ncbi:MAG: hypothetical protein KGJ13_08740 [Patescibacteria group bacterium]|nr:hypothetical protein [Patescibacteria group bacterium]
MADLGSILQYAGGEAIQAAGQAVSQQSGIQQQTQQQAATTAAGSTPVSSGNGQAQAPSTGQGGNVTSLPFLTGATPYIIGGVVLLSVILVVVLATRD